ncbi:MAG: ATP-binding protein [Candidatus Omnitrophota bacterium]
MKDILIKKISEVFKVWRNLEAKRKIYGLQMLQVRKVIGELYEQMVMVVDLSEAFAVVKKQDDFEIIVKESADDITPLQLKEVSSDVSFLKEIFDRFSINSITFYKGLQKHEVESFLKTVNTTKEKLDERGGIVEVLSKDEVKNIILDEMKFELLTGNKSIQDTAQAPLSEDLKIPDIPKKIDTKQFNSTWENYLSGKIDSNELKERHNEIVDTVKQKPQTLTRVLKKLAGKQKEIELFIANLEQKLFDLGFPAEAVENLKSKLSVPRKVKIDEAELLRLRRIENNFQKELDKRVDESMEAMSKIKKRLSDDKERTEAILRQMSQGCIILDQNGIVLSVNSIAQKVLGVTIPEVQGKRINDLLKGHHLVSMVARGKEDAQGGLSKTIKIESKDEKIIDFIRESSVVIEDQSGNPIGALSSLQNKVELEELERRKSHIMDVIGHDLKLPVGAAKFNLSMLTDDKEFFNSLDERQQKIFNKCMNGLKATEDVLNKIMDVRYLETGKILLKKEKTSINKIAEDSTHALEKWAMEKKINLNLSIEDAPEIEVDSARIYEVINNLISNALKFTLQEGTIEVRVGVVNEADKQFVQISVSDPGIGIEEKDLKRIFNKYEQVSLKRPEGATGLGLGLSICKIIVELHRGSIWAESEPGKGSTFFIHLPI